MEHLAANQNVLHATRKLQIATERSNIKLRIETARSEIKATGDRLTQASNLFGRYIADTRSLNAQVAQTLDEAEECKLRIAHRTDGVSTLALASDGEEREEIVPSQRVERDDAGQGRGLESQWNGLSSMIAADLVRDLFEHLLREESKLSCAELVCIVCVRARVRVCLCVLACVHVCVKPLRCARLVCLLARSSICTQ